MTGIIVRSGAPRIPIARAALRCLILCIAAGGAAMAQWNPDPAQATPICTAPSWDRLPITGYDVAAVVRQRCVIPDTARAAAVIVWCDSGSLKAQRIGADGVPRWQANGLPVNTFSVRASLWPMMDAVEDGAGGCLIGYSNDDTLLVQRLDTNGTRRWGPAGISAAFLTSRKQEVKMLPNGRGGAFVAWSDGIAGAVRVLAQQVDSNGTALWDPAGVIVHTIAGSVNDQSMVDIVPDGKGGIIAVWENRDNFTIRARRVTASAQVLWPLDGVSPTSDTTILSCGGMVPDGEGGIILSWRRRMPPYAVSAQRLDSSGNRLWSDAGRAVADTGVNLDLQMLPSSQGGAYLFWHQGSRNSLMGQRLSRSGDTLWRKNGVALASTNISDFGGIHYTLCGDGHGGAILAFTRPPAPDAFPQLDIHAQRVDSNGTTAWPPQGAAVCTAADRQDNPVIAEDGAGGAYVAWTDNRRSQPTGGPDIYASRIRPDGTLFPVDYSTFTARHSGGSVLLAWTASSDAGTLGFEVQRGMPAPDPGGGWTAAGFVPASASGGWSEYRFEDPLPPAVRAGGVVRYRLRQSDADGGGNYSPVVELTIGAPAGSPELRAVYPDPAMDRVTIRYALPGGASARIALYSLSGRLVAAFEDGACAGPGEHLLSLDASRLAPGGYFVELTTGDRRLVRRFMVR